MTELSIPASEVLTESIEKAFKRAWADEDQMAADIGDGVTFTDTGLGISRNLTDNEYTKAVSVLMADQRVAQDKGNLGKFRQGDLMRSYAAQHQLDETSTVEHFHEITKLPKSLLKALLKVATNVPQPHRTPSLSWGCCEAALRIEGPKDPTAAADFHALKIKLLEEQGSVKNGRSIVLAKLNAERARLCNEIGPSINPKTVDSRDVLMTNLIEWYQLKQMTDTRLHVERFPEVPETAWFTRMRQIESDIENLIVAVGHKQWSDIDILPFQYFPK